MIWSNAYASPEPNFAMTSVTGPSRAIPERTVPGLTPAMRARARWLFRIVSALSPALAARLAMRAFLTPLARPIEPEEEQFLATAQSQALASSSGALQVYTWPAPAPEAPTVLLVHGWISHAARMADIVRALQQRGIRVVAFDAPAHGRSGGTQADLHGFRAAIQTVIARCGPVHGVLAHSFGALSTASWLAEDRPATLRAVVLVGMMRDLGYIFDSFTQALALSPAVSLRFRELFRARYGAYPEDVTSGEMVRRLHMPVLLVHGAADDVVPSAHAQAVSKDLRAGRLLIAPDLGHGAPLRDPATVQQIVDFFSEQLAP
jgi:alpha-beta hydrolase superfamily lysophospholipase